MKLKVLLGSALISSALPSVAFAEPVLLISIDGLQPTDIIDAEKRGIAVPNLQRFIKEGSYATGVRGVLPTVTYPSHATLLTGVSPDKHGIIGNTSFDPLQINQGGWFWYASDFKVPTLWDAVTQAGMTTANVHWPVSVNAKSIKWNIPQIWRTGHADDAKLMKALATRGLIESLEQKLGAYAPGIDETIEGDETRGRFAVELITQQKPDFATVYLTALDHEQHVEGPNTPKAHAILKRIDEIVGRLVSAHTNVHPNGVVAVVSDHGFSKVDKEINLYRAFIDAGLMTLDASGKIISWEAAPWNSGGSSAIVLARPDDNALRTRVFSLLTTLKSDPKNRISAIADTAEVKQLGGNQEASFYVNLESDAYSGNFKGKDAPLVGPSSSKGMHGYFPTGPLMQSAFMMMGPDVAKGQSLGEIDMRAIAPTLAKILGVSLLDASATPDP